MPAVIKTVRQVNCVHQTKCCHLRKHIVHTCSEIKPYNKFNLEVYTPHVRPHPVMAPFPPGFEELVEIVPGEMLEPLGVLVVRTTA